MKKLFFALLVLVISMMMFVPTAVFAGEKTIRLNWEQNIPDDFLRWDVYRGTVAGGPYTYLTSVPYVAGETDHTSDQLITAPDGVVTMYYIVLISLDTGENPSPYSNEASVSIDFEAPDAAFSLTITIVAD